MSSLKVYSYYNRKFAVQASNPEKAYLPKRDLFELQLIFAKHETRKLDSGLSFSFKGQKYRLPVNAGNKKVPASPHDTITVATSKYIGVQVLYKGLVIEPEPLKTNPKKVYHKNLSKKTLCWAYRLNPKVNLKTNPLGLAIPECFIPKQTG